MRPVTVRTDVFNFGATMYWALSGKKIPTLFTIKKDENSFLLHDKIETAGRPQPQVPEPLSNLVMECIKTAPQSTRKHGRRRAAAGNHPALGRQAHRRPGRRAKNQQPPRGLNLPFSRDPPP